VLSVPSVDILFAEWQNFFRDMLLTCDVVVVELIAVRIQVFLHARYVGIGDILLPSQLGEALDP
jgi:hypothetical protein